MEKTYRRIFDESGFRTYDELYEALEQLDSSEIMIKNTKKKVHYTDRFGDDRIYINDSDRVDFFHEKFISFCEIEKFFDCFPMADPVSVQELEEIYYNTPKIGTMKPSSLMPEFEAEFLFCLYAIANLLLSKKDKRN